MTKETIQAKLLDFLTRNFMVELEDIPLDKSLIDEGIIDSFGLLEIAAFLDKEFNTAVKEVDMIRSNFGSVLRIVDFAWRKMQ